MVKSLEPESYDHLCGKCRSILSGITTAMEENGADTDNCEAPCDWMWDHRMFCGLGGYECGSGETNE